MFLSMCPCCCLFPNADSALQLVDVLKKKVTDGPTEIDVLDWNTRVALELIGQGGLGHSFDCLSEHSESSYSRALKSFVSAHDISDLTVTYLMTSCIPLGRL